MLMLVACDDAEPPPQNQSDCDCKGITDNMLSADINLYPESLDRLPGWSKANLLPALQAFMKSCVHWYSQDPQTPLSHQASYGGKIQDWLPLCRLAPEALRLNRARAFFETNFNLYEVAPFSETSKLTGYYEPELQVYAKPHGGFSTPIPGKPKDLIEVDLGQFETTLTGRKIWGQWENGEFTRYPERADIAKRKDVALAYGHPADVFFLQIQGSGRLNFPDGKVIRARFAAHNHHKFGSLANYLINKGLIKRKQANMSGIRAWMDRTKPEIIQEAMNANPRFVFFAAENIINPALGPKGAQGVHLTAMGSLAIDRAYHPFGVPVFIQTRLPNHARDWRGYDFSGLFIAQDTGGAIKGARRGDIFYGLGQEAGNLAGATNAPGRFWVFLPKTLINTEQS